MTCLVYGQKILDSQEELLRDLLHLQPQLKESPTGFYQYVSLQEIDDSLNLNSPVLEKLQKFDHQRTIKDAESPPRFGRKKGISQLDDALGPPRFGKRENINTINKRNYARTLESKLLQLDNALRPPRFGKRENNKLSALIGSNYGLESNLVQLDMDRYIRTPSRFSRKKDIRHVDLPRFEKRGKTRSDSRPPRVGKREVEIIENLLY